MIRLLSRLSRWLEARFPEKFTVTAADYEAIKADVLNAHMELADVRSKLNDIELSLNQAIQRIGVTEINAVHKDAVKDVISVVAKVQEELRGVRFGLGLSAPVSSKEAEITALLNGQVIGGENE